MKPLWYNYDLEKYVSNPPMLSSDETAIAAIQPWPGARELYRLYREMGDDIPTAFLKLSYQRIGEEYQEETP